MTFREPIPRIGKLPTSMMVRVLRPIWQYHTPSTGYICSRTSSGVNLVGDCDIAAGIVCV